jgi:hypothetical protein
VNRKVQQVNGSEEERGKGEDGKELAKVTENHFHCFFAFVFDEFIGGR